MPMVAHFGMEKKPVMQLAVTVCLSLGPSELSLTLSLAYTFVWAGAGPQEHACPTALPTSRNIQPHLRDELCEDSAQDRLAHQLHTTQHSLCAGLHHSQLKSHDVLSSLTYPSMLTN